MRRRLRSLICAAAAAGILAAQPGLPACFTQAGLSGADAAAGVSEAIAQMGQAVCFAQETDAKNQEVQGTDAENPEVQGTDAENPEVQGTDAENLETLETDVMVPHRIAVLTYSYASEYWGYVQQGCQAWDHADPTVDVEVESVSSSVAKAEQLAMLEADLESGRYDAYVIAAIDREMVEDTLKDVALPVIAIDSPFDAKCVVGGIGTDNRTAAAAGARKAVAMAQDMGHDAPDCVMIGGQEEDTNHQSRMEGFRAGVEDAGGVWLDAVYPTDKSAEQGAGAMRQIMEDYPEGVAVVACYNDRLAESAIDAASGNEAYADTVFLGFDGNGSVCEKIMNDDRYENMVTVAQNPYEMGFGAVKMMSEYLAAQEAGKEPGAGEDAAGGSDPDEAKRDGGSEAEDKEDLFTDSGYAVITKVNVLERMVQIRNHLS